MLVSSHLVCCVFAKINILSLPPPPHSSGEIAIAQASKAQQILRFTTKLGYPFFTVNGTLLCTNFRVCFVPDPSSPKKKANAHVCHIIVIL